MLRRPFAKHPLDSANDRRVLLLREAIHGFQKTLVALLLHLLRQLAFHFRSRSVLAFRVAEHEGVIELQTFYGIHRSLEILLGLAWETDDDVSGDRDVWPRLPHLLADLYEFRVFVRPPHRFQNPVRSALHREMNV